MKILTRAILLFTLFALALSATPICTNTTLDQYLSAAHGGSGALTICTVGSLTYDFTNTIFSATSVLFATQLLTKSQILVTPISDGTFGATGLDIHAVAGKAFALDNASLVASGTATYALSYSVSAPSAYFKGVVAEVLGGTQSSPNPSFVSTFSYNKTVKDLANTPLGNPAINQNTPTEPTQINSNFKLFSTGGFYSTIVVSDQLTLSVGRATLAGGHAKVSITDMENLFVVPEPGTVATFSLGLGFFSIFLARKRKAQV